MLFMCVCVRVLGEGVYTYCEWSVFFCAREIVVGPFKSFGVGAIFDNKSFSNRKLCKSRFNFLAYRADRGYIFLQRGFSTFLFHCSRQEAGGGRLLPHQRGQLSGRALIYTLP